MRAKIPRVGQFGRAIVFLFACVPWTIHARAGQDAPKATDAPAAEHRRIRQCMEGDTGCTVPPRVLYAPNPDYSKAGRKGKIEGVVALQIIVTTAGEAEDITVTKKLGYGLDEEAVKAVKKWKFKPASRDGIPVDQKIFVQVNFRLY